MNVVVLVIDRLHAGYLGCYGNTWISTPAWDRLSAESFVFDQSLAAGPRLDDAYTGYWIGRHAAAQVDKTPAGSLPSALQVAGYRTMLLSDDQQVLQLGGAEAFDDSLKIDTVDNKQAAAEIEDTHLAQFFAAAIESVEAADGPFLLWLHTRGLGGPWDAPREFRTQYAEEGEAEPPRFVDVPSRMLRRDDDPDELWAIVQAYAGQVSLLDACLGVFTERLGSGPGKGVRSLLCEAPAGPSRQKTPDPFSLEDTLLVVTAPRGFPLGEHRHIGVGHEAPYGELLRTPWLMRFPASATAGLPSSSAEVRLGQADRSQVLAQPADLFATLLECCGVPSPAPSTGVSMLPVIRGEQQPADIRDRVCMFAADGEQAIHTPAWFLRESPLSSVSKTAEPSVPGTELFAKPDDRWEFNNVADRCPAVVAGLRDALADCRRAITEDDIANLISLPEDLTSRPE